MLRQSAATKPSSLSPPIRTSCVTAPAPSSTARKPSRWPPVETPRSPIRKVPPKLPAITAPPSHVATSASTTYSVDKIGTRFCSSPRAAPRISAAATPGALCSVTSNRGSPAAPFAGAIVAIGPAAPPKGVFHLPGASTNPTSPASAAV